MNVELEESIIISLYEAILELKTVEETELFFKDLCTINELKAMAQRLEVAKMLDRNQTYIDIQNKTNASTTTISRVNRALMDGSDGYKMLINRLKSKE